MCRFLALCNPPTTLKSSTWSWMVARTFSCKCLVIQWAITLARRLGRAPCRSTCRWKWRPLYKSKYKVRWYNPGPADFRGIERTLRYATESKLQTSTERMVVLPVVPVTRLSSICCVTIHERKRVSPTTREPTNGSIELRLPIPAAHCSHGTSRLLSANTHTHTHIYMQAQRGVCTECAKARARHWIASQPRGPWLFRLDRPWADRTRPRNLRHLRYPPLQLHHLS
jgi:hypothetical protein